MPEKLRIVFVMFELEEMSGEDIARLLDVPVGTVRSRLRLARAAFQRELKLPCDEHGGKGTAHQRRGADPEPRGCVVMDPPTPCARERASLEARILLQLA